MNTNSGLDHSYGVPFNVVFKSYASYFILFQPSISFQERLLFFVFAFALCSSHYSFACFYVYIEAFEQIMHYAFKYNFYFLDLYYIFLLS